MKLPKLFDIHSHIHFAAYDNDREEVLSRAHEAGVWMINVGTERNTSQSAVLLAEKFEEGIYATVGIHPTHTGGATYHDTNELRKEEFSPESFSWNKDFYKNLARNKKVVAIGECGLDYFRLEKNTKERQEEAFIEHIYLANEVEKPLMLHIRPSKDTSDAYEDAYTILREHSKVKGNLHFFVGSLPIAKKFWSMGFPTSFTGVITFTSSYDEIIRQAPEELIMSETDCPYVTPLPHRGKRNEPAYLPYIVKKMASLRNAHFEAFSEKLVSNARDFFLLQ